MIKKRLERLFPFLGLLAILLPLLLPEDVEAQREHLIYFQNTPYELNVYKIYGQKQGPTLMIIGGIQGNEPGGFLSADLYADFSMKRGSLIVVPRANFYSILLFQRGAKGDMNRKFGPKSTHDTDAQIVTILKKLIAESDFLLNLHDGWGYYRPRYVSKIANPMRYGQSIIADCAQYYSPALGRTLHLKKMAEQVIEVINAQIENPKYHFHFMDTRTGEKDSPYTEQRLSATYYALTKHGIPAFGVETSKNLPSIEMKVRQHNLAINAFMEIFSLEPEQPRVYLHTPKLKYLVISVNGRDPVAVADKKTLYLHQNDTIEVVHVEANYERGLSVDIKGVGTINDFRQRFTITRPTIIMAQKDHIKFGRVHLALYPKAKAVRKGPTHPGSPRIKFFILEVEGRRYLAANGECLEAFEGDLVKVVDVITERSPLPKGVAVNFKGFVPKGRKNTGEDRGFIINTAQDLMERYCLSKTEKIYAVVVEKKSKIFARMTIRLNRPKLDYIILRQNGGPRLCLHNGESLRIQPGDQVQVLGLKTDAVSGHRTKIRAHGQVVWVKHPEALLAFKTGRGGITLIVTREGLTLGKIHLTAG
ncbi:MAG: hypothetical protein JRI95_10740 [Deltaproteobacteria bacterium]|nr:hypothetical protein [Deltaproteobacteria bacterium]MBW2084613.1 hypothetical protein [Deltaproteobacteria bacterium]